MNEITELLQALVSINSINPDLVSGGAGEGEIAHFVADWLETVGLDVTVTNVVRARPNVVAIARGTGGGKTLMLNAHMDTVGVAGMTNPFIPRIEGNRLYGRGAYDMKGSLAAIMLAIKEAQQLDLKGDVILTAVVDEEFASIGTQAIVDQYPADAAIVTEPTDLNICVAHKGFVWAEIMTTGIAAHGSRYDLGVDAITEMGKVITELETLAQQIQNQTCHPLLGSGSLHTSTIRGGQELSSYPEHCLLQFERRTLPGEMSEQVDAEIQEILQRIAQTDEQFKGEGFVTLTRDAYEISQDAPIVQTLNRHANALCSTKPEIIGLPFWMDSAILASADIPSVIFGPVGAGAHAVEEWVDLESLQVCKDVLIATIQDFCG